MDGPGIIIGVSLVGASIGIAAFVDYARSVGEQEKAHDLRSRIHGNLEAYLNGKTIRQYKIIRLETSQSSIDKHRAENRCIIDICKQMDSRGVEFIVSPHYDNSIVKSYVQKKYKCELSGIGLKPKSTS
ncbi:hypothetical protein HN865_00285 [Candidatus Woesearchaeota archaeon]|jgi:hypothetical protein|nr:hypothetical protein [Candidatus Woesearchaeota archaeon]MBT7237279.1 hypothetical protein [Candidatus Woesearchaeota archaeon]